MAAVTFRLTSPGEVNCCPACGVVMRSRKQHVGSKACAVRAYEQMKARLGVERFFDDPDIFSGAGLVCVRLRSPRGHEGMHSVLWAVDANDRLRAAGVPAGRRSELLAGGEGNEELERELALAALGDGRAPPVPINEAWRGIVGQETAGP